MPEAEKISEPYYNDNDVITLRELTRALETKAMHFYSVSEEETARQLFEAGLKSNPRNMAETIGGARNVYIAESRPKKEEPITKAQLRDALLLAGSKRYDGYLIKASDASQAADRILEAASNEYPHGQIVQDDRGDIYRRHAEGWHEFGNSMVLPFSFPKRPLRKIA